MKAGIRWTRRSMLTLSLAGDRLHPWRYPPYEVTTPAAHVRVTVPIPGVFRVSASGDFPEIPSCAVEPLHDREAVVFAD